MDMIDYWHGWLIIAFIILIVELMSGTYFLLALAGGAFISALLTWLYLPALSIQLLIFAVGSALSYAVLSSMKQGAPAITDGTQHMLGQSVDVVESIENRGRVRYKGVIWQAQAVEHIKKGEMAEITAINGSTLTVKSIVKQTTENTGEQT